MALWMVRAGKYGEHEQRFFSDGRCYLTWGGTEELDLSASGDFEGVKQLLATLYPDEKPKTRLNWASQIYPFVFEIKPGDWIVLPRKHASAIAFAEVQSGYAFDAKAEPVYRHSIKVRWLNTDVPRTAFAQDLLYSFGAFMTVCRIAKNDAETRVNAMRMPMAPRGIWAAACACARTTCRATRLGIARWWSSRVAWLSSATST